MCAMCTLHLHVHIVHIKNVHIVHITFACAHCAHKRCAQCAHNVHNVHIVHIDVHKMCSKLTLTAVAETGYFLKTLVIGSDINAKCQNILRAECTNSD